MITIDEVSKQFPDLELFVELSRPWDYKRDKHGEWRWRARINDGMGGWEGHGSSSGEALHDMLTVRLKDLRDRLESENKKLGSSHRAVAKAELLMAELGVT